MYSVEEREVYPVLGSRQIALSNLDGIGQKVADLTSNFYNISLWIIHPTLLSLLFMHHFTMSLFQINKALETPVYSSLITRIYFQSLSKIQTSFQPLRAIVSFVS
jgi:hypothetical protein